MRRLFIIIGALGIALVTWVQLRAQQEMLQRPGPGSGIIRTAQHGEWEVAINNTPTVRIADTLQVQVRGPAFVRNRLYKITWPNGDEERVTVIVVPVPRPVDRNADRLPERSAELTADTWAEVQTANGNRRWINFSAARAIEEVR